MSLQSFLAIVAFIMIIVGLLFLSMIHLFMIPKDVMKRDTEKREENPDPQPQPVVAKTPASGNVENH